MSTCQGLEANDLLRDSYEKNFLLIKVTECTPLLHEIPVIRSI